MVFEALGVRGYLIQLINKTDSVRYINFKNIGMEANGINYYKGVLLCSRPNESPSVNKIRSFCGRVNPSEQIGLVPVKQYDEHKTKKRVLPVLNGHIKWLQKFKKDVHQHKEEEQKERQRQAQRLEKIKQEGYESRQKLKNASTQITNNNSQEQEQSPKKTQGAMKKKQKPVWAKTAAQNQVTQEHQVDQLLNFFSQETQSDIKDYVSDGEVKGILTELKGKIEKLKEQEDWRKEQLKRIDEDKSSINGDRNRDKDDVLSRISRQSGAQSVSSQKTAQRVQQLQRKKQAQQWDKISGGEKKTMASVDEQIAKHVADEVLRNYPHLKHHSNHSIRQLFQKHAHEQIKS